jgi:uncharacterized protein
MIFFGQKKLKKKIIDSRVQTTKKLVNWIKLTKHKPTVMISASAIGVYGCHEAGVKLTEDSIVTNQNAFSQKVCLDWEREALKASALGVRVCIARLAVVMGKRSGYIKKIRPAFLCGLGGKIGNGKQAFSWIDIRDVVRGFHFLIINQNSSGLYNFSSPKATNNKRLTDAILKVLNRKAFLFFPCWFVKLVFGQMGQELLLSGNHVYPKRLVDQGFNFLYQDIESVIKAALAK